MKINRLLVAAVLAVAIAAPLVGFVGGTNVWQQTPSTEPPIPFLHGFPTELAGQPELASLDRADEWLNSPPLSAKALRGKVVLVDFWTYTCINWRRTLPFLRAWHEKYGNQGLGVIGVHAPAFSFQKHPSNYPFALPHLTIHST